MMRRACIVGLLCCLGAVTASAADARADTRRSGYDDMSPATQAMQRDDTLNPAMLWVQEGEALWNTQAGGAQKSCAGCHGDAASSMRGVAARYPAWDRAEAAQQGDDAGAPHHVTASSRVSRCRKP